jgi:hypothetical protein
MRAVEQDRQAAAPDRLLKDLGDGGGLKDAGRRSVPQEQLAMWRRVSAVAPY